MSQRQEITDLTICRAVFAAWVFVYHVDLYLNFSALTGPFAGLIRHGYFGVDGFFMLSGMILARVHSNLGFSPTKILNFWARRLARIYPVHLTALLLIGLILAAGLSAGFTPRDPTRFGRISLVENLLLIHSWGFATQGDWNYPSWSVSTEWAGYLIFPLPCLVVAYFERIVAAQIIITAFLLLGLIIEQHHFSINLYYGAGLQRFFPEFLIGIATARIVPGFADLAPRRGLAVAGAVITAASACLGWNLLAVIGIWAILFAFMMQADAEAPPMLGSATLPRRLGLLSYAFYMSFAVAELLVTQLFRNRGFTPPSHAWLFAAAMLGITTSIALILHLAVEIPCRRTADRFLDAR
jgi:peptidoglycan/LPS O-acetylase OafA/YrhL